LLFERDTAPGKFPVFGQTEDRCVSTFLDPCVFNNAGSAADLPDRISAVIEVLRIRMLSSYEDKRISIGVLLSGGMLDACHSLPKRPADALPYSSELTSFRSFHRICDGLRTIAVVDERGYMVEVLFGGHICLVLTPNGEIKVFGEGVSSSIFLRGGGGSRTRLRNTKSGSLR
jgi:hypothetical protein